MRCLFAVAALFAAFALSCAACLFLFVAFAASAFLSCCAFCRGNASKPLLDRLEKDWFE